MLRKLALVLWLLTGQVLAGEAEREEQLREEGLAIAGQFVGMLKPQLQAAIRTGGPSYAISVCSKTAPAIAMKLSEDPHWQVGRVSLKARNGATASPDDWEAEQLRRFDQVVARGGRPGVVSAWVGKDYRVMKPQYAESLCLACHGERLAPEVVEALQQYYPDDLATGYSAGQVRGAISLRWVADSAN